MKSLLQSAIQKAPNVDLLEIRVQEKDDINFTVDNTSVDNVVHSSNIFGNVRVLIGNGWGFVSFTDMEQLASCIDLAIKQARLVNKIDQDKIHLAEVKTIVDEMSLLLDLDPRDVHLEDKINLIKGYNKLIMDQGTPITSSIGSYSESIETSYLATSEGTYIKQSKCHVRAGFSIVVRQGDIVDQFRTSINSVQGLQKLYDKEAQILQAAKNAKEMVKAKPVKGGVYSVVLDQIMSGLFIHEAFGHLSEADGIFENESLRNIMKLGNSFGSDILTVKDSAVYPNLSGSYKYDDEGVPVQETVLIENGVLTGRLHSRQTAAAMGEAVTGNSRAINYLFNPIVRMTNTCIANGNTPFDDMLQGVKEGIYLRGTRGGTTMKEMFTFAAQEAFMIRDGQLAERVKNVVLTGNVFETLENIDAIGDDFKWNFSTCGKAGQSWIKVGMGGPHIRIRNVVVGGE